MKETPFSSPRICLPKSTTLSARPTPVGSLNRVCEPTDFQASFHGSFETKLYTELRKTVTDAGTGRKGLQPQGADSVRLLRVILVDRCEENSAMPLLQRNQVWQSNEEERQKPRLGVYETSSHTGKS